MTLQGQSAYKSCDHLSDKVRRYESALAMRGCSVSLWDRVERAKLEAEVREENRMREAGRSLVARKMKALRKSVKVTAWRYSHLTALLLVASGFVSMALYSRTEFCYVLPDHIHSQTRFCMKFCVLFAVLGCGAGSWRCSRGYSC